jgi:hypothetical protein
MQSIMQSYMKTTWMIVAIGLYLGYISTSGTKTQFIRLLDIFFIGPLMIYFGHIHVGSSERHVSIFAMLLVFFGATTIIYNLKNYIHASK